MPEENLLSENSGSDLSFLKVSNYAVPMDAHTLLMEYADGRRGFNGVELKQVNLYKAKLTFIHLDESNLYRADLRYANLAGASLNHTDLSSSNMAHANCIGADMIRAKLAGADLSGAFLSGANLSAANLRRANLTDSSLAGANLSGADLSGAIIKNTNLEGTNFRGANLTEANLEDISSLNLEGAILTEHQAKLWELTQKNSFPNLYDPYQEAEPTEEETEEDEFSLDYAAYDEYQAAYQNGTDGDINFELSSYDPDDYQPENSLEEAETIAYTAPLEQSSSNKEDLSNLAYLADEEATGYLNLSQTQAPIADSIDLFTEVTASFDSTTDGSEQQDSLAYYDTEAYSKDEAATLQLHKTSQEETALLPTPPDSNVVSNSSQDSNQANQSGLEITPEGENAFSITSADTLPRDDSRGSQAQPTSRRAQELSSNQANLRNADHAVPTFQPTAQDRVKQAQNSRVVQSIQSVLNRRVQYSLQQKLLEIYNYQCAITHCPIRPLLETTLITGSDKTILDHPSNGLVLRSDLKTLYDLHLLAIHPNKLTVLLSPTLLKTDYAALKGRKISIPTNPAYKPNPGFLKHHLLACKWYSEADTANDQIANLEEGLLPFNPRSLRRLKGSSRHSRKLAIGLGAAATCSVLVGVLWFSLGEVQRIQISAPMPDNQKQEEPLDSTNAINLKTGPVVYQHGGLILENSAYLPITLAKRLGVTPADIPAEEIKEHQGETYFKASYLKKLGTEVDWNAGSRTLSLDCCSNLEVQSIDLNINEQETSSGIIVDNSAYIPATALEQLNLNRDQIQRSNFLEYDQTLYLKAASLKELSVQSQWNGETRALSLNK